MADNEYIKRSEVVGLIEDKLKRYETVHEALAFASLRTAVMGLRSADVAPRAEVEELIHKLECLLCHATGSKLSYHTYTLSTMENAVTDYIQECCDEAYDEAREEVAREIFEEIKEKGSFSDPCVLHVVLSFDEIAEIEKKYTDVEPPKGDHHE